MTHLFDPLTLRGVTMRNRIGMSPMCQYSAEDGRATAWHAVHLGSRAVGGAGLIIVEATAVQANARISPWDLGLWRDDQAEALRPIVRFMAEHGAVPGIQLAHAGRKANTARPWEGGRPLSRPDDGWRIMGASAIPFKVGHPTPQALTLGELRTVREAFVAAAVRAVEVGFRVIEIHAAHGYLLHSFYSPLANERTDPYGGSFENRVRLTVEIAAAVRATLPDDLPLAVRISSTDWVEGGWTLEDSIRLAGLLKDVGVDLVDCSSGGNIATALVPAAPSYQVGFAREIRRQAGVATSAVGLITDPLQANAIVAEGDADVVLVGRELLRNPYWPLHAAQALGADSTPPPPQYARAF